MFDGGLSFGLGEEIGAFAARSAALRATACCRGPTTIDRDNDFPETSGRDGALGLLGITAEPDYGGLARKGLGRGERGTPRGR